MAGNPENMLSLSWRDTSWLPHLNQSNVMDYFSERSNPFYDKNCNNETIKMQRLSLDQLNNMTGIEYTLLHVQEPILYVIRKLHRHSPTAATPLLDYYIIAGTVYQAPDLCSVVNSRLLNCMHSLQSAFEEAQSYSRYHPSRGYWWAFKDTEHTEGADKEKKKRKKEEPSSYFQRQRVDVLLGELAKKYPPKIVSSLLPDKPKEEVTVKQEKPEIKVERTDEPTRVTTAPTNPTTNTAPKPPPEKKPKLMR